MERKEPALISLLARLFIKPDPAREEPETRRAYGVLCGIVGICLNVLLFAGKFLAGTLSGSIAITADAFNNLSDAGSSFVTLVTPNTPSATGGWSTSPAWRYRS